ncbi:tautomerase family protein [Georgenia thermotolerans]|uniref:4-oxalocrotonate tautomerase n=1 Tax=Georgenia thermotolerans TaxID=527326 RepID=A0A7J5UQ98_9MICO|nr:tautomerase family protein [Georgenia thermotolerans]KAE8764585.1 4-oxalocrotonate tautomerase [Georgenia thermotolerans]
MPLVEVTLTEGRAPEQLRELMRRLHDGVHASLGANPDSIRVIVREVPRTLWCAGGQTLAERDAAAQPAATDGDGPRLTAVPTEPEGR